MQDNAEISPPPPPFAGYRPETPWGAPTALIAAVMIMFASVVLPVLVLLAYQFWRTPGATFSKAFLQQAVEGVIKGDSPLLAIVLIAAPQLVVLALTVWLAGWRAGDRRQVLARRGSALGWAKTAGAIVAVLAVSAAFDSIVHFIFKNDLVADMRTLEPFLKSPLWPLFMVVVVVGAPLSEEFLFRGFLFSALAKGRFGLIGAALVTDALWTLLHVFNGYSLYGMASIFVIGLLLSLLLWRTGSIWPPIFCHAANNLIAMGLGLWLVSNGSA